MDLQSFVRIVAKKKVVAEEEKAFQGTGYFITRDLVLTCRHVVEGAEAIRIYGPSARSQGDRHQSAEVVWSGREDLDAALLRVHLDSESQEVPVVPLAEGPLIAMKRWESRGCVSNTGFTLESELESMLPLHGPAHRFSAGEKTFKIELVVKTRAEYWQGISGAPVWIDGRLHGVVARTSKKFSQIIEAVPVIALMEDPRFVELVEEEERRRALDALIETVESLLKRDTEAVRRLAEQHDPWAEASKQGREALASVICRQTPVVDFLRFSNAAHRNARKDNAADSTLSVLEELTSWVLPILSAHRIFGLEVEEGLFLRLPVATETMAELVMAGLDERTFRFLGTRREREIPTAEARIHTNPECGFDLDSKIEFRELVESLVKRFLLDRHRSHLLGMDGLLGEDRVEEAASWVNDELVWQAQEAEEPLRHYYLCSEAFAERKSALISRMSEHLPAIRIVHLDGDDIRGEEQRNRPLYDFLKRKQERTRP